MFKHFFTFVFKNVIFLQNLGYCINLLQESIGLTFQLSNLLQYWKRLRSYGIFFVAFFKYYSVRDEKKIKKLFFFSNLIWKLIDLKPKNLYSPGYKPLLDIITIPRKAFFISIDKLADACGTPHQSLLFDSLSLRGLSLVLIRATLNLSTQRFTVDLVIKFCVPHIAYIIVWISLFKIFSRVEKQHFETNMFQFGTASSILIRSLTTRSVFVHWWNVIWMRTVNNL